jgi:hypothetical protein
VSFPMRLLDGYDHVVLASADDAAKLLVRVGTRGLDGLALDLASRCPAATLRATGSGGYRIEAAAFHGDLSRCEAGPGAVLLEVRAPDCELRTVLDRLPVAVGRYVLSRTGSSYWGAIAGVAALVLGRGLGSDAGHRPQGDRHR